MKPLKTFKVNVEVIVDADEDFEAIEMVTDAFDRSNLLDQDGIVGFEISDEAEEDES